MISIRWFGFYTMLSSITSSNHGIILLLSLHLWSWALCLVLYISFQLILSGTREGTISIDREGTEKFGIYVIARSFTRWFKMLLLSQSELLYIHGSVFNSLFCSVDVLNSLCLDTKAFYFGFVSCIFSYLMSLHFFSPQNILVLFFK